MELDAEKLALLRAALDTARDVMGEEANEITFKKGPKSDAMHRRERELRIRSDALRELIDYIDNSKDIDPRFEPRGFRW